MAISRGDWVVVRGFSSGVHYGKLYDRGQHRSGHVMLEQATRVCTWGVEKQRLCTLSELVNVGPSMKSELSDIVPLYLITDGIETLKVTNLSRSCFEQCGWGAPRKDKPEVKFPDYEGLLGNFCIVRGYGSGVFGGTVEDWDDRMPEIVVLSDGYRIRSIESGSLPDLRTLHEVALYGLGKGSVVSDPVKEGEVSDAIEIIPCSEQSKALIVASAK